jgi:hypothetical protein
MAVEGLNGFGGQSIELPEQSAGSSHAPVAERQITDESANTSGGHSVETPSHTSSTSHGPAAARHTVPSAAGEKPQAPLLHMAVSWHGPVGPGQELPQAPQSRTSVAELMQLPLQHMRPSPQTVSSGAGEQKPTDPGRLHVRQSPSQAVLQQTPSTQ